MAVKLRENESHWRKDQGPAGEGIQEHARLPWLDAQSAVLWPEDGQNRRAVRRIQGLQPKEWPTAAQLDPTAVVSARQGATGSNKLTKLTKLSARILGQPAQPARLQRPKNSTAKLQRVSTPIMD